MSYDLFFLRRPTSAAVPAEALLAYFTHRPNYAVKNRQAWYENESTGVYFSFDLTSDDEADSEPDDSDESPEAPVDDLVPVGLSFNMNYFRPHFFALEAEPELTALVEHFSLLVDDPQSEGMGRGAYSRDGFLRSWNAGNAFGHSAIVSQTTKDDAPATSFDALPSSALENAWAWNFRRDARQSTLGDDVFVPGIRLVRHEGRPKTFVVWGDAIPIALPEVDLLVLVRDELAPRRLFVKKQDICLVSFSALRPLLTLARRVEDGVPYHLFQYDAPPSRLIEFFRSQQAFSEQLDGLPFDKVLSREVLDRAKARMAERQS
jgi:hypothetical protein